MHNPESVSENEMHKLLWNFDIQKDPLIGIRRQDSDSKKKQQQQQQQNKENLPFHQTTV